MIGFLSKQAFGRIFSKNFSISSQTLSHLKRFLIIGANGQLGRVIKPYIVRKYGIDNVLFTDIYQSQEPLPNENFQMLNIAIRNNIKKAIANFHPDCVINLASGLTFIMKKGVENEYRS